METTSQAARYKVQEPGLIQLYSGYIFTSLYLFIYLFIYLFYLFITNNNHMKAATPNGMKVAAALEELVDLRKLSGEDFSYEPHTVNIRTAECRQDGFTVSINPNGKIPAIIDPAGDPSDPICVW